MKRAVLLAHPAGHSLSPVMHDAAFAQLGLEARYEAWDVPPHALPSAVERLRAGDVLGANVTVPHKTHVLELLDDVRPAAATIGAANVIVREGMRLVGDNSDGAGFLRSLAEADVDPAERHVVLLGAGGAARAVGWALVQAGAETVTIVNRTRERAETVAELLTSRGGPARVSLATDLSEASGIDLWVNATSLGMRREGRDPRETPVDAATFERASAGGDPVAVDLVYRPRRTPFLRAAERAGLRGVDGAGMLLHQGAVAFEAWTGRPAPVDAMRHALDGALTAERPA